MGNRLVLARSGQTPEEKKKKQARLTLSFRVCRFVCAVAVVTHLTEGCQGRAPAGTHGARFSPSGGKGSRVLRPTNCSAARYIRPADGKRVQQKLSSTRPRGPCAHRTSCAREALHCSGKRASVPRREGPELRRSAFEADRADWLWRERQRRRERKHSEKAFVSRCRPPVGGVGEPGDYYRDPGGSVGRWPARTDLGMR